MAATWAGVLSLYKSRTVVKAIMDLLVTAPAFPSLSDICSRCRAIEPKPEEDEPSRGGEKTTLRRRDFNHLGYVFGFTDVSPDQAEAARNEQQ